MKYICRQVNPVYQESPIYRDVSIWNEVYDRLFLVPTENCYGIRNDVLKNFFNNVEEAADEWYAIKEESSYRTYDTITELSTICFTVKMARNGIQDRLTHGRKFLTVGMKMRKEL